jgi:tetraacyldisaccharide 4'-kinase
MEQRVTKLWYRDTAGPSFLQPLSWLYAAVVWARRKAYSWGLRATYRVDRPVVVVGNLTVGGTGKTPLVTWLARRLAEAGMKVGIVSRGYGSGGAQDTPRQVTEESNWQEVGDEPLLLYRATGCATVVGRDRVAAARVLVKQGVDVIVADDGLQHLRLARDCEIVVIDGGRGFGNRRLLPAGPLRESVSRLAAADVLVINGLPEHSSLRRVGVPVEARAMLMTLMPGEAVRLDGGADPRPLHDFRGRPVHAVAGIGNPERFFQDLSVRGLSLIEHPFADHHPFAPHDLAFDDDLPVLMTQKDAVKCIAFADSRMWAVPTAATFSEAQAHDLLGQVLRKIGPLTNPGG